MLFNNKIIAYLVIAVWQKKSDAHECNIIGSTYYKEVGVIFKSSHRTEIEKTFKDWDYITIKKIRKKSLIREKKIKVLNGDVLDLLTIQSLKPNQVINIYSIQLNYSEFKQYNKRKREELIYKTDN